MALAHVALQDLEDRGLQCSFDIGTNRFYSYSVGENRTTLRNGVPLLAEPAYTSALHGPLPAQKSPPRDRKRYRLSLPFFLKK